METGSKEGRKEGRKKGRDRCNVRRSREGVPFRFLRIIPKSKSSPINRGTSDRGRRNLLDTTNRSIRARFHEGEGKIIRIEYFFPVRAPTRIRHRCDNEKLSVVLLR